MTAEDGDQEFVKVPKRIREQRGVSWPAKAVACHLAFRQRGRPTVHVGVRLLAEDLGMAPNSVTRALHEADAAGLLRIVKARPGRRTQYDARPALSGATVADPATLPGDELSQPLRQYRLNPCDTSVAGPATGQEEEVFKKREGEAVPPLPSVRESIHGKDDTAAVAVLVEAYIERSTKAHRVNAVEVANRFTEDVFNGRYTALDLAGYLDAHRVVTCWPRELVAAVAEWLNLRHAGESDQRRLAACSVWRSRLADVRVGDEAWRTEKRAARTEAEAAAIPAWHVAEVDAEGGIVTLRRSWSGEEVIPPDVSMRAAYLKAHPEGPRPHVEQAVLADPEEGRAWTFGREAVPLLAGGNRSDHDGGIT